VEYSDEGITVKAHVGPISFSIVPQKEKKIRARKKKAPKKDKKRKVPEAETKIKKPGELKEYLNLLPVIKKTLRRLRRRLLIKTVTIHFVAGDKDPSKAALAFGSSNVVFAAIVPVFDNAFRIKQRDFRTSVDFESAKPLIYVKAAISIAIWETFYIAFTILPSLLKMINKTTVRSKRKDAQQDG
jgi:hypothetical protein